MAASRPAAPRSVFPFVVGCQRSGTTLLQAMLDCHSRLSMAPESHFIVPLARRFADRWSRGGATYESFADALLSRRRFAYWALTREELLAALAEARPHDFAGAIRTVYARWSLSRGKDLYGDKTPRYVGHMPGLAALLPEARFVHLIRDGRDVALSMAESFERAPQTAVEAALFWRTAVESGRRDGSALGADRYLEVRYEELTADPNPALEGVCRFLGLEMEAAMLSPASAADRVLAGYPDHSVHRNLGLPVEMRRDWRNEMPEDEIARFEILAGDVLSGLSYEVSAPALNGPELERRRLELVASEVVGLRRALFAANRRGGAAAP